MSAIQNLEYLKYFTLKGNKFNVGFRSKADFTDWIGNEIRIETPEGLEFILKSIRIDFGSFSFSNVADDPNYLYKFDLRNILDNPGNNVNNIMIPNFSIDSNFDNENYKSYIFISEFYKTIKFNQPDITSAWQHEYFENHQTCDKYPHSMVIVVKDGYTSSFEDFMNISYVSWKNIFDSAIFRNDLRSLQRYHPSIFRYEINFEQAKLLLENFEVLSPELTLAILKPKAEETAVQLMNYLRNSTTNLNFRLFNYFTREPFNLDYFIQYNEALMELGATAIDRSVVETIAINEVNTYINHPNADWNIFNKLAEDAGVFVISTKPIYTSHFGIFNYFPQGATININPFNTAYLPELPNIPEVNIDRSKIHFGYSALIKSTPIGSQSNTIARFPEYDPFEIVKLYIVEDPQELKYVENYKGFIDVFFTDPKLSKVKYSYMPAICAYNFYLLNFTNHHDVVKNALIKGALIGLGTAITLDSTAPFTIPWYLGTATTIASLTTLAMDSPALKDEILDQYGQDGQDFIDAWHTIESSVIALDFAYAGFYGIKNLTYFITNKAAITLSKETFYLKYWQFNLRIRQILTPFYESVYKNLEKTLIESAEYEALLAPHLLPGKKWSWVVDYKIANGKYPPLSDYLKADSIAEYDALLESEGVSFFITEREIVTGKYTALADEKFVGIQSHMEIAELNFIKSGKKIEQLLDDLAVDSEKYKYTDKIYHVKVKGNPDISLKMPDGNSPGSRDNIDWRPGGFLKNFKNISNGETIFPREAVFFKTGGGNFVHNNIWTEFVDIFGASNVKQIYP